MRRASSTLWKFWDYRLCLAFKVVTHTINERLVRLFGLEGGGWIIRWSHSICSQFESLHYGIDIF